MPIRVLPHNIPLIWEAIKFAAVKSDDVREENIPVYLTNLLHSLLGEKAQCFVRLDDERRLVRLAITRIKVDEITGDKTLVFSSLYSFKSASTEEWKEDIEVIKEYARKHKCKKIIGITNNEKIFEVARSIGFKDCFKHFIMEV